ncbi:MAG: hypothetical protein COW84_01935 [Gammaproteobacteria bacterium CG22_combo_CG10-13_8_21_14_all_40_8]|nr:MAG: hypothetical protein COW84_01935 [Gammaproteobacteria bacterium CG22_combo_CG10-13_8_21_14_all_40_8]
MDIYATEEEQAEAVKQWIKENGAAVVIGATLGLGALFGWRYWQGEILNKKAFASEAYDNQVLAINSSSLEDLEKNANLFLAEHPSKTYNNFLQLRLAKKAVEDGKNEVAIKTLNNVLKDPSQEAIAHLARIRLARILIETSKPEEALKLLNKENSSYKALYAETRGDAYNALGEFDKARTNYQLAQSSDEQSSQNQPLQYKIDALPKEAAVETEMPQIQVDEASSGATEG